MPAQLGVVLDPVGDRSCAGEGGVNLDHGLPEGQAQANLVVENDRMGVLPGLPAGVADRSLQPGPDVPAERAEEVASQIQVDVHLRPP